MSGPSKLDIGMMVGVVAATSAARAFQPSIAQNFKPSPSSVVYHRLSKRSWRWTIKSHHGLRYAKIGKGSTKRAAYLAALTS